MIRQRTAAAYANVHSCMHENSKGKREKILASTVGDRMPLNRTIVKTEKYILKQIIPFLLVLMHAYSFYIFPFFVCQAIVKNNNYNFKSYAITDNIVTVSSALFAIDSAVDYVYQYLSLRYGQGHYNSVKERESHIIVIIII